MSRSWSSLIKDKVWSSQVVIKLTKNRLNHHSDHNQTLKMKLSTELQYTLASFIGFMLESICYGKHRPTAFDSDTDLYFIIGIYCVIFAAFIRIRLKRKNKGSKVLLYLIITNFIACTAFLAICAVIVSQPNVTLGEAPEALYTCIDFISQVILVNFTCIRFGLHHWCEWLSLLNKDIPLLDHVAPRLAPTMGYGCPDPVNTCIPRC